MYGNDNTNNAYAHPQQQERLPMGSCSNRNMSPQPGTPMSQPGTPVAYYQTLYHHPGTPQMTPQSPASSVRSVGSFAPIGYPQAYAPPIQSPVYTGVGGPYASPLSQSVPQQQGSMGEYAPPVYQLPYGAIPQQQQQAYRYPSPSPVAAAATYYGAYHPGMIRSGGGSPTNSIRSLSSDGRGMPQSPMNMGAPMVLQRDPSGNMILPPVGYFVRDAENVDPDNLCYADIRQSKPEPPSTGDSLLSASSIYRSPPETRFQSGYANAEHQQHGEGPRRHHHHHRKHVQQTTIQQEQQGHEESGNTLRTLLQELDEEDENCIFIVRRIHKFGFKSPVFLREYFEGYGQVCKVLVAHSRQLQPGPHDTTRTRSRPASLGFVLMGASESVQRILADGPTHKIADVEITVHHFENRHPEKDSQAESSQDQQHSQ